MAREEVIQELRWIKEGTVLNQEARNALDIAITALKSKYICEEIAFMCNLSGGADYFSAFEQLSKSLTKLSNTEDCGTCKHGYFGDEQCNSCRVRFTSHYERRTDE